MALAQAQTGRADDASRTFTAALAAARSIESAERHAEALSGVAVALAQAGHPEQALAAARSIESAERRAEALSAVAAALVQAGYPEQALAQPSLSSLRRGVQRR